MSDTVYVGARVLLGDAATVPADAIVLRDGRVRVVGARDAMVRLAVVVDRDPLTCVLAELAGTRVLRTVLAGRTVWDAGAL